LLPYGASGWGGVAAAVASSALRVAVVPLFVTPLLDRVIAGGDLAALPGVLAASGTAVGGMALLLLVQDALLARSGARLAADQRERLYETLLARTPGRLPGTSGGLAGRILADLREVELYHQGGLGTLAAEAAAILGIVAVLAWRAPLPTAALLALGLPAVLLLTWLGRRLRTQADRAQAGSEAVAAHLQEGLRHHAVARVFGAEGFLLRRFGAANEATRRAASRRGLLSALQVPASQLAIFAALAVLVTLLAGQAVAGRLSVGEVVEYMTLVALLATPAQLLPRGYAMLRQAEAATRRMAALAAPPDEADGRDASEAAPAPTTPGAPAPPAEAAGSDAARVRSIEAGLVLDDVWARHPGGPWVLRGASATLPARGLVALIGASGAGKTTLLSVLLGLLPAERGRVALAGRPLALADARLGWVPQSLDLLRGSLRSNLALDRPASDDDLRAALRAVGMEAAVDALPAGLDHALDEDGSGLSGGQRQRLLVARALLRRPAVLVLDEPTANLDAEAEAALIATLRREAERRLVVAVAHRAALAHAADHVVRLDDGRLLETSPSEAPTEPPPEPPTPEETRP
jgi:ABC-type multidrug transport system fused ATPase/permease subunit